MFENDAIEYVIEVNGGSKKDWIVENVVMLNFGTILFECRKNDSYMVQLTRNQDGKFQEIFSTDINYTPPTSEEIEDLFTPY